MHKCPKGGGLRAGTTYCAPVERGFPDAPEISYYNGNRWTMEWAHGRNLTRSVTLARSTVGINEDTIDLETALSYTYDAEGIRTGRTHTTNIYGYRLKSAGDSEIMSADEPDASSLFERYTIVSTTTEHYYISVC